MAAMTLSVRWGWGKGGAGTRTRKEGGEEEDGEKELDRQNGDILADREILENKERKDYKIEMTIRREK